ncbi:MAG: glycosyltransferase [Syntrophobacteraceae bacterium]|nr:glycosyltransferase [Syntrophobacteraceae bacterium]
MSEKGKQAGVEERKDLLLAHGHSPNTDAGGNSTRPPSCSVCIANYNGIDLIGPCIESVIAQDFNLPVEIIVHDDASSDESVSFIRTRYPTVKLIPSKENVGFCVSNNRMAEQARGEYLLLLNNDAILRPDAIKTLYEFASKQETPGILGIPQYDLGTGELLDIGDRLDLFLNSVPNRERKIQEVGQIMGACLWVPRRLWHELGGFPAWFGSLAEETYLCCLARLKGYSVTALPTSGYDHLVGGSFGGGRLVGGRMRTSYRRRALAERNKSFTMAICYPSPYFYVIFPLHLSVLALEGLLLSCIKRDLTLWRQVYVNCMRELWTNRKKLKQHRRDAQKYVGCGPDFWKRHTVTPHKLKMLIGHGLPRIE